MARQRVMVYEDPREWRYYWLEGASFVYILRAQPSHDLTTQCAALAENGAPPPGSVGRAWTPDLFDDGPMRLIATYDKAHGGLRLHR